jgi:hypothetical protein
LTYEYNANGGQVESYSLNSGNSAPRGAASTIAGDKTWVVDANKRIYVYNNSGVMLGSWTAGSLASNATIEGITTNGTDVWLVDTRQDRVYRYANAASRLSGSQNAISNFALNSGNTSPKDLVTDGASLWVVNDSTTDRVFKYSMTGALVGSWTIDSANKSPTGLTIDPSGASQSIWIVDNGTDRVYEYTNSRSRNSGSQSASLSFALAAGNTNPQGIADPPAPTFASMDIGASMQSQSTETEVAMNDHVLSAPMPARSFATVQLESRNPSVAHRLDSDAQANANGWAHDSRMMDSKTNVIPSFAARPGSPIAALATVDEVFSDTDSLLGDHEYESLLSTVNRVIKTRRLR